MLELCLAKWRSTERATGVERDQGDGRETERAASAVEKEGRSCERSPNGGDAIVVRFWVAGFQWLMAFNEAENGSGLVRIGGRRNGDCRKN